MLVDAAMIAVTAAGQTAAGRVRDRNEDAFVAVCPDDPAQRERKGALFAVADGLGGHGAGEVASATALAGLVEAYYAPTSPARIEPALSRAVQVANLRVLELAARTPGYRGMQTTLSCLVVAEERAYLAHIGDSRIYLARGGTLRQLTADHSEVAELVRLRLVKPEAAATHPRRNMLTRTLGADPLLRPDFARQAIAGGDTFLLCSDGVWSEVADGELLAVVSAADTPGAICQRVLDLQFSRASLDNATALVVQLQGSQTDATLDGAADTGSGAWLNMLVRRLAGARPARDG